MFVANSKSLIKKSKTPIQELSLHIGAAAGVSVLTLAASLALVALVRANVDLPFFVNQPLTTVLAAASAFVGAYVVAAKRKKSGLVLGASSGTLVFLVLMAASAIFTEFAVTGQVFVKLLALVSAGGIGGITGTSKGTKTAKIKR